MDIVANIPPLAWGIVVLPGIVLAIWLFTGVKAVKHAEEEHEVDPRR